MPSLGLAADARGVLPSQVLENRSFFNTRPEGRDAALRYTGRWSERIELTAGAEGSRNRRTRPRHPAPMMRIDRIARATSPHSRRRCAMRRNRSVVNCFRAKGATQ